MTDNIETAPAVASAAPIAAPPLAASDKDILSAAYRSDDRRTAVKQAWEKIYAQRAQGTESAPANPATTPISGHQATEEPNGQDDQPGDAPSFSDRVKDVDYGTPEGKEVVSAALVEATDGAIDGTFLAVLNKYSRPFANIMDETYRTGGPEGYKVALEAGADRVTAELYHGSAVEFEKGIADINEGIKAYASMTGTPVDELKDKIDVSGVMFDPTSHRMLANMARSLKAKAPKT